MRKGTDLNVSRKSVNALPQSAYVSAILFQRSLFPCARKNCAHYPLFPLRKYTEGLENMARLVWMLADACEDCVLGVYRILVYGCMFRPAKGVLYNNPLKHSI